MASTGGKFWALVLRCHLCGGKFTQRRLTLERVHLVPQVTPCPHCGARPYITAPGSREHSRVHHIFDLREEPVFRKTRAGDTWHFSYDCSHWPGHDYLVLDVPPRDGDICNECKAKQGEGSDS
ncbi:MAG TPA: hypothetical protein VGA73_07395 [Candidatus Binatia bacterium]